MKAKSRHAVGKDVMAAIVVMVMLLVVAIGSILYGVTVTSSLTTVTETSTTSGGSNIVNLDVIADWGGAGYDAFIVPTAVGPEPPTPATNSTAPGTNNDNVTVSAGVPITFVISNIDTAVLQNFTGPVTTPLSIYNDTNAGQTAIQYKSGQTISNLPISHTFTISSLGLNIPLPPDTIVTFTYTFDKPGTYTYICLTPCGPGMMLMGYMIGSVIVK